MLGFPGACVRLTLLPGPSLVLPGAPWCSLVLPGAPWLLPGCSLVAPWLLPGGMLRLRTQRTLGLAYTPLLRTCLVVLNLYLRVVQAFS